MAEVDLFNAGYITDAAVGIGVAYVHVRLRTVVERSSYGFWTVTHTVRNTITIPIPKNPL